MTSILQASALAVMALGTGAATVGMMTQDLPDYQLPDAPWALGAELDGRVFHTQDRIVESGEIVQDELHFMDGRFQSAMCQDYCDFGWSLYQTWTEGDVIHFSATTRCPDAPHTVVWHGQVIGDKISFKGTWTTRRWYWTRQINTVGEGSVADPAGPAPSG